MIYLDNHATPQLTFSFPPITLRPTSGLAIHFASLCRVSLFLNGAFPGQEQGQVCDVSRLETGQRIEQAGAPSDFLDPWKNSA